MVQIIAEAVVNHNSDIVIAKKLVDVAAEAGADWVKFQTFKANNLLTKSTPKAKHQEKNSDINESHFDMIKRLELSHSIHLELIDHCNRKNIKKAMGDGIKRTAFEELKNKKIVCKSIVAARAISAGDLFNENNLAMKRPGIGLSPMRWDEVIGRVVNRNFSKDELNDL